MLYKFSTLLPQISHQPFILDTFELKPNFVSGSVYSHLLLLVNTLATYESLFTCLVVILIHLESFVAFFMNSE
jgi:hypothetical protein